ncbi:MAG TPA: zf-HC2 domain-containing protein [Polyangiales bacterium]|nr:zf-HC2 domain-containing protein [Polyangiales bacterium]
MSLEPQERPEGCPTDLRFDAWSAGELDANARALLEAHLDGCARCRDRHAALAAERAAYLELHPRAELRIAKAVPARALRWPIPAALLGAAAAVALFLALPAADPSGQVRRKGAAGIGFFVEHGGTHARGRTGQSVHPGDRIRFTYTSDRPAYLVILARDAAGTVSVYFPSGDAAGYVSEGYDRPLDSSVELDATLGAESVFALFCERGFGLAGPRSALTATHTLVAEQGCQLAKLSWTKERAP